MRFGKPDYYNYELAKYVRLWQLRKVLTMLFQYDLIGKDSICSKVARINWCLNKAICCMVPLRLHGPVHILFSYVCKLMALHLISLTNKLFLRLNTSDINWQIPNINFDSALRGYLVLMQVSKFVFCTKALD